MILTQAFLAGPQAMDAVGVQDYAAHFEAELDSFTLSLAAYGEALETEEEIEAQLLMGVDQFRNDFRRVRREGSVLNFHASWNAFSMLLRGIPEESRVRAAERVRHAMSSLFATDAGGAASGKVTPQNCPALYLPVTILELGVRAERCLRDLGVLYIGELVVLKKVDLLRRPNFGRTSLADIQSQLRQQFGLSLDMTLNGFDRADAERVQPGHSVPTP